MPHQHTNMTAGEWPWYQPWARLALFSASLNVVWEMLAMSFYDGRTSGTGIGIAMCLTAALGDVGIALGAYAIAARLSTRQWIVRPTLLPFMTYVACGLVVTILSEYLNVHILQRWSYRSQMLTVAGVAMLPMLQWLVLPPIVLLLSRQHLHRLLGRDL